MKTWWRKRKGGAAKDGPSTAENGFRNEPLGCTCRLDKFVGGRWVGFMRKALTALGQQLARAPISMLVSTISRRTSPAYLNSYPPLKGWSRCSPSHFPPLHTPIHLPGVCVLNSYPCFPLPDRCSRELLSEQTYRASLNPQLYITHSHGLSRHILPHQNVFLHSTESDPQELRDPPQYAFTTKDRDQDTHIRPPAPREGVDSTMGHR